ncbi:MAG: sulfotransferase family 2 domain-containing protein [Pseudomonadota bacterium]
MLVIFNLNARLYFIHIPKTGGTTLHALLENKIYLDELYPPRRMATANMPVDHELVSGHFPIWFCESIDDTFEKAYKLTILRDPVDRCLSMLRYYKKTHQLLLSLEAIFKITQGRHSNNISQGFQSNLMCHFFSSQPNLTGNNLLESAKKNLDKFDFVVFFENFKNDVNELCHLFDIKLDDNDIPHFNTTNTEEVSSGLIDAIKQENSLDIQLYRYAKQHLKRKHTFYKIKSRPCFEFLSKKNTINYTFCMPLNGVNFGYRENVDRFSIEYPIYRWVMDKEAKIYFNLEKNKRYDIQFTAQPLTQGIEPRVKVNGIEISVRRLNHLLFSSYRGEIPKELISDEITEITFFSPYAYQYNEIYPGYADNRVLSFAMDSIQISSKEF